MSEETVASLDEKQAQEVATEKQAADNIPYARFKDVVSEKNELKTQLDSIQKQINQDKEDRKVKDLEAKGEYDTIVSDLKTKLESADKKADAFDQYQASRRESLLSKMPEDDRVLYDGVSLENLEKLMEKQLLNNKSIQTGKPGSASIDAKNIKDVAPKDRLKNWGNILDSYRN
jgi:hypothetical protein